MLAQSNFLFAILINKNKRQKYILPVANKLQDILSSLLFIKSLWILRVKIFWYIRDRNFPISSIKVLDCSIGFFLVKKS